MRITLKVVRHGAGCAGAVLGFCLLIGCQKADKASADIPPPVQARSPVKAPADAVVARAVLPEGLLPRSMWTKADVARPAGINPMNGITRITIHHDGQQPFTSTRLEDAAKRIESVRLRQVTAGRKGKMFADIGYHYIIDPAGRVWEGRNVRYQGAHVENNNENNLGILCLGNFELQKPTPAMVESLDRFIASQMRRYNVPLARVKTHREINTTANPGQNMQMHMVETRKPGGALYVACTEMGLIAK